LADRFTLSIDAMGGDNAPRMVVRGLNIAVRRLPRTDFLLFGDREPLEKLLRRYPRVRAVSRICHTDDVVDAEMKASAALRGARDSSMRRAIDAVVAGEASGVVSAGNTGALMALAKFVLRTVPGIDRPAIAASFPTRRGQTVVLDLGANIDCDSDNLSQFAVMGEVFAQDVLGIAEPAVGILNVGVEGFKGNEAVRRTSAILRDSRLPIRFHGFVEGDDIGAGTVDVVVTDGFTGNIALKTMEGTARTFAHFLRIALRSSPLARIGSLFLAPAMRAFRHRVDPRHYNGAMLLGLNGICVKSHGGTDAVGFANAVRVAADLVSGDFNERMKEDLGKLFAEENSPASPVAAKCP
jgi:phosphate acyltransferase